MKFIFRPVPFLAFALMSSSFVRSFAGVSAGSVGADQLRDLRSDLLESFPKPRVNWQMFIILPKKPDMDGLKLEIVAGKTVSRDACNTAAFDADLVRKEIPDTHHVYYELNQENPKIVGTLMGCKEPAIKKYTPSKPHFVELNRSYPIVVYVPKSFTVKYRLWSPQKTYSEASAISGP